MEWCREYQHKGVQGLVDKRIGGNSAKLSKLQIEDLGYRLRQYSPRDLYGPEASQYWTPTENYLGVSRNGMGLSIAATHLIYAYSGCAILVTRKLRRCINRAVN